MKSKTYTHDSLAFGILALAMTFFTGCQSNVNGTTEQSRSAEDQQIVDSLLRNNYENLLVNCAPLPPTVQQAMTCNVASPTGTPNLANTSLVTLEAATSALNDPTTINDEDLNHFGPLARLRLDNNSEFSRTFNSTERRTLIFASFAGPELLATIQTFDPQEASTAGNCTDDCPNYCAFGLGGNVDFRRTISQHGITITFSANEPAVLSGQYINGDYWVVGPVVIEDIDPNYLASPGRHGQILNNSDCSTQPYDSRDSPGKYLPPTGVHSVPIGSPIHPPNKLVKTISRPEGTTFSGPNGYNRVQSAMVLTILSEMPENGGCNLFRPGYAGNDMTQRNAGRLRTDVLNRHPEKIDINNRLPLAQIVDDFYGPCLDDMGSPPHAGRIHPIEHCPDYGEYVAEEAHNAVVRLVTGNETFQEKLVPLVHYVQRGIDVHSLLNIGCRWAADGGHSQGRKAPLLFAGFILDDQQILDDLAATDTRDFAEDGMTYFGTTIVQGAGGQQQPVPLWGTLYSNPDIHESRYWARWGNGGNLRDPYGYIDGGSDEAVIGYQSCCSSGVYTGAALFGELIPEARALWDHEPFFEYASRYYHIGGWTIPDPCAATPPSTYNGQCVSGSGRFPERHGTYTGAGVPLYIRDMWEAYKQPDFWSTLP